MWAKQKVQGFTIVELLIVIVVIGILAAITIVSFNGVTAKARGAKINSDTAQIKKAIAAAEASSGKTLNGITGSWGTGGSCWSQPAGTDLSKLDKTSNCWTDYYSALNKITAAGGINVQNLTDPWGRPYMVDENEGEGGGCTKDTVAVFALPITGGYYWNTDYSNQQDVPFSGNSNCS